MEKSRDSSILFLQPSSQIILDITHSFQPDRNAQQTLTDTRCISGFLRYTGMRGGGWVS
jgi:hypothetical protein